MVLIELNVASIHRTVLIFDSPRICFPQPRFHGNTQRLSAGTSSRVWNTRSPKRQPPLRAKDQEGVGGPAMPWAIDAHTVAVLPNIAATPPQSAAQLGIAQMLALQLIERHRELVGV
jgi:hypothetical protein